MVSPSDIDVQEHGLCVLVLHDPDRDPRYAEEASCRVRVDDKGYQNRHLHHDGLLYERRLHLVRWIWKRCSRFVSSGYGAVVFPDRFAGMYSAHQQD